MKKISLLLLIFSLFACSNDDDKPVKNNEFLNQIVGIYLLEEMHSDISLDLNLDGIPKTNLLDEIECYSSHPPEFFRSDIIYKPYYGDYMNLTFVVAEHRSFFGDIPQDDCFSNIALTYDYAVNEETKEIIITWRDEEREAEHGRLTDVKWMDDRVHYWVNRQYYTPDGWTTATIHLVYKKYVE